VATDHLLGTVALAIVALPHALDRYWWLEILEEPSSWRAAWRYSSVNSLAAVAGSSRT
jgi:hypothetical protein